MQSVLDLYISAAKEDPSSFSLKVCKKVFFVCLNGMNLNKVLQSVFVYFALHVHD